MRILIKLATSKDHFVWDDFINSVSAATPYHLFGWKNLLLKTNKISDFYLMAYSDDKLISVYPNIIQSKIFPVIESNSFISYGAPIFSKDLSAKDKEQVLRKYDEFIKEKVGGLYAKIVTYPPHINDYELNFYKNYKKIISTTMIIDLSVDYQKIWSNFSKKGRRDVKKAKKLIWQKKIKIGKIIKKDLGEVFKVYSETYTRTKGDPIFPNIKNFKRIFDLMEKYVVGYKIEKNKQIIGFILLFKNSDFYYYCLGGHSEKLRDLKINTAILFDTAIKDAKNEGIKTFDLGGFPTEEFHLFKKSLGAKEVLFIREIKIEGLPEFLSGFIFSLFVLTKNLFRKKLNHLKILEPSIN